MKTKPVMNKAKKKLKEAFSGRVKGVLTLGFGLGKKECDLAIEEFWHFLDEALQAQSDRVVGEILALVMLDSDLPYSDELKRFVKKFRESLKKRRGE